MVEAYFYIPSDLAEDAVECGIKLSQWCSREAMIAGEMKKCISALLNPRDDYEKYVSSAYRCLKLEVQSKYCFAADALLYEAGKSNSDVMELYYKSIMPIEQYTFGKYRLPECLITSTVIGEQIHLMGKGLDTPVLFDNSQELYFSNIIECFKEEHEDFNDTILYHLLKRLCLDGKVNVVEDDATGLAVFTDKRTGQVYTLRIPDMDKY